jgi:hypothetical protein
MVVSMTAARGEALCFCRHGATLHRRGEDGRERCAVGGCKCFGFVLPDAAKRGAEKLTLLLAENWTLKKMLAVTDEEADKLRVELQDWLRKLREQQ